MTNGSHPLDALDFFFPYCFHHYPVINKDERYLVETKHFLGDSKSLAAISVLHEGDQRSDVEIKPFIFCTYIKMLT